MKSKFMVSWLINLPYVKPEVDVQGGADVEGYRWFLV